MIREQSPLLMPLTTAQRGMWMGSKLANAATTFNLAEAIEIFGQLDTALFVRALQLLALEVETTRVRIVETSSGPMQEVLPEVRTEFPVLDLSTVADPDAAAHDWMMSRVVAPVDLNRDPLWTGAVLRLAPDRFIWFHCCHHVAIDGYSGGLIAARVAELYTALTEGRAPIPHAFLPVGTLLEAESEYRSSPRHETDRTYWLDHLKNPPAAVSLATGLRPRNPGAKGGFIRRAVTISHETVAHLSALGREHNATLPQVLVAILAAYAFRLTGQADLVLGMPVSGRSSALRLVPGMAANAVALRFAMATGLSFVEILDQARRAMRGCLRHQRFRYEDLRRELGLHEPGQQITRFGVNIEPFDYDLRFGGLQGRSLNLSNGAIEDLTVFVFDRQDGHGLSMVFDANPNLYAPDELEAHAARAARMIDLVLAAPREAIGHHDLLSEADQTLLRRANDTARTWPGPNVAALVRAAAGRHPARIAIIDSRGSSPYGEMALEIRRLSQQLVQSGIGPGDLVAVLLPRDRRMVVALLAIVEAGAAWLPLDPNGPPERLRGIMADAGPALLLTAAGIEPPSIAGVPCRLHETGEVAIWRTPAGPGVPPDTAYVAYTSGTTGAPKGVIVPHAALGNLLFAMQESLAFEPSERLLSVTTLSFDIAILELFLPLMTGASVAIATEGDVRDPQRLAALIARHSITAMQATPSLWMAILGAGQGDSLRGLLLLSGGEPLSPYLAENLHLLGRALFNLYGPTETTIWSSCHRISRADIAAPPVGRPIANTQLHVLGAGGTPLPPHVVGDLAIGGDGVANGYLGQAGSDGRPVHAGPVHDPPRRAPLSHRRSRRSFRRRLDHAPWPRRRSGQDQWRAARAGGSRSGAPRASVRPRGRGHRPAIGRQGEPRCLPGIVRRRAAGRARDPPPPRRAPAERDDSGSLPLPRGAAPHCQRQARSAGAAGGRHDHRRGHHACGAADAGGIPPRRGLARDARPRDGRGPRQFLRPWRRQPQGAGDDDGLVRARCGNAARPDVRSADDRGPCASSRRQVGRINRSPVAALSDPDAPARERRSSASTPRSAWPGVSAAWHSTSRHHGRSSGCRMPPSFPATSPPVRSRRLPRPSSVTSRVCSRRARTTSSAGRWAASLRMRSRRG